MYAWGGMTLLRTATGPAMPERTECEPGTKGTGPGDGDAGSGAAAPDSRAGTTECPGGFSRGMSRNTVLLGRTDGDGERSAAGRDSRATAGVRRSAGAPPRTPDPVEVAGPVTAPGTGRRGRRKGSGGDPDPGALGQDRGVEITQLGRGGDAEILGQQLAADLIERMRARPLPTTDGGRASRAADAGPAYDRPGVRRGVRSPRAEHRGRQENGTRRSQGRPRRPERGSR